MLLASYNSIVYLKKFETANFKIKHNDLFNQFCTEIEYNEFKAIGDNS